MVGLPLAEAGKLQNWLSRNRFHHSNFSISGLATAVKDQNLRVSVIIPSREVADTVGGVISRTVKPFVTAGVITSVIAIDNDSKDGTGEVAARHGATVLQRANIASELGPSQGKGDALWRALQVTDGDIVAFLDGDTSDPDPAHLLGILGPLILRNDIEMVRGCFDRPFKLPNGDIRPHEGGRVNELVARPLLNIHFPQLAGFRQPLAGEFAARRSLLEKLSFPVGYGVEIGTLIDAWQHVGLAGLAEVDLGTRQNQHKPLRELGTMAFAVMSTLERRLGRNSTSNNGQMWLPWHGAYREVSAVERPPLKLYLRTTKKIAPRAPADTRLLPPPFIKISGLSNFRDIGSSSRTSPMRRNVVYRGGGLSFLTQEGCAQLAAMGIQTVFDLRSFAETEKSLDNGKLTKSLLASTKSIDIIHAPIFKDEDFSPEAMTLRFKDYASEGTEGFKRAYRKILLNCHSAMTIILDRMSKSRPILVTCQAGKDRTGVIVMLLLLLSGCSADTVAEDYHLSEQGLGEAWKQDAIDRLSEKEAFADGKRQDIENMIGARKDVMLAVIEMVERDWGGVEGFLTKVVGISKAQLSKYRKILRGQLPEIRRFRRSGPHA